MWATFFQPETNKHKWAAGLPLPGRRRPRIFAPRAIGAGRLPLRHDRLNLPEDESFFTPWDLLAEVKSFMEQLNYVVLVGTTWRGPSVKWVPLLTEDIAKEFRAIRFLNAGSHAHLVLRGVISIGDEFLNL